MPHGLFGIFSPFRDREAVTAKDSRRRRTTEDRRKSKAQRKARRAQRR